MKGGRKAIVVIEASATVNDTIQKFPETVRVLLVELSAAVRLARGG